MQTKHSENPNPSIEEILDSIRGVIGEGKEASVRNIRFAPQEEDEGDIVELTMEIPDDLTAGMAGDEEPLLLEPVAEEGERSEKTTVDDDVWGAAFSFDEEPAPTPKPEPEAAKKKDKEVPPEDFLDALLDGESAKPDDHQAEDAEEPAAEEPQETATEPEDGNEIEDALTEEKPMPEPEPQKEEEPEAAALPLEAAEDTTEKEETAAAKKRAAVRRLLAEDAAEQSTDALKSLVRSIPRRRTESPAMRPDTTLEELVIEAIKPYLAEWLNRNLADIVKQLVAKEIKKLIPKDEEE
jgi:cell pole-organizing protein PopZ